MRDGCRRATGPKRLIDDAIDVRRSVQYGCELGAVADRDQGHADLYQNGWGIEWPPLRAGEIPRPRHRGHRAATSLGASGLNPATTCSIRRFGHQLG